MRRTVGLSMVFALLLAGPGCAAFRPEPTMMTCRDSAGRFASCGSGPSGETVAISLGVAAGIGLVAGIIYLATRSPAPPDPSARHCHDARGRDIEIEYGTTCGASGYLNGPPLGTRGSGPEHAPATHRCHNDQGGTFEVSEVVACASMGYADGPAPSGPRILRCYTREGVVTPSHAASCSAAGLFDGPGGVTATPDAGALEPTERPPTGGGVLQCFDPTGAVRVSRAARCEDEGLLSQAPQPAPVPAGGPLICYDEEGNTLRTFGVSCAAVAAGIRRQHRHRRHHRHP